MTADSVTHDFFFYVENRTLDLFCTHTVYDFCTHTATIKTTISGLSQKRREKGISRLKFHKDHDFELSTITGRPVIVVRPVIVGV